MTKGVTAVGTQHRDRAAGGVAPRVTTAAIVASVVSVLTVAVVAGDGGPTITVTWVAMM